MFSLLYNQKGCWNLLPILNYVQVHKNINFSTTLIRMCNLDIPSLIYLMGLADTIFNFLMLTSLHEQSNHVIYDTLCFNPSP